MTTIAKPKRRTRGETQKRAKASAAPEAAIGKISAKQANQGKPGAGTKLAAMISLLSRKKGATIAELMEATSWQQHSVRGAISGTLKKKLGLTVTSDNIERRGRVYRIASGS